MPKIQIFWAEFGLLELCVRCWVPKKSGKGENRAAQSSKFNYTSLYQCQLNTCLHLPHLFRRSEFFHDFDAGSTCSTSWYKFLPYVLMWRCPYLKCWFNLTKSRQQLPIPKFFFLAQLLLFRFSPIPPPKKYESFKINYKTVKKLGDVLILPIWI